MIQSKKDLKKYIQSDMPFYRNLSKVDKLFHWLTSEPLYEINKYVKYLRKEEYYANTAKTMVGRRICLYYVWRKNRLGNRLGFKIPRNRFGKGLEIYHHGCIIVNDTAKIGDNCKLHGNNCIGNNGKTQDTPILGNNVDLGFGAVVIGGVKIGDNAVIGANAVVVKSVDDDKTAVGVPAKEI